MGLIIELVFANVFLLFLVRGSSPILFSLREGSFMLSAWMLFPIFHILSVPQQSLVKIKCVYCFGFFPHEVLWCPSLRPL